MNLLQKFEEKQKAAVIAARNPASFPEFNVGDTIIVGVKVPDGAGFRVQNYEGVCIGFYKKGIRTRFMVRRIACANESMVQTFMLYLSNIDSVKVVRQGKVRRAKLYYLLNLIGKAARIKSKSYN